LLWSAGADYRVKRQAEGQDALGGVQVHERMIYPVELEGIEGAAGENPMVPETYRGRKGRKETITFLGSPGLKTLKHGKTT
jgi:hypothetical protein